MKKIIFLLTVLILVISCEQELSREEQIRLDLIEATSIINDLIWVVITDGSESLTALSLDSGAELIFYDDHLQMEGSFLLSELGFTTEEIQVFYKDIADFDVSLPTLYGPKYGMRTGHNLYIHTFPGSGPLIRSKIMN